MTSFNKLRLYSLIGIISETTEIPAKVARYWSYLPKNSLANIKVTKPALVGVSPKLETTG